MAKYIDYFLAAALLVGCSKQNEPAPNPPAPSPTTASAVQQPASAPNEIDLNTINFDSDLNCARHLGHAYGIASFGGGLTTLGPYKVSDLGTAFGHFAKKASARYGQDKVMSHIQDLIAAPDGNTRVPDAAVSIKPCLTLYLQEIR